MFDLPIRIVEGPDVSNYQETAHITRVEFTPSNFIVRHTKEGKREDSWEGTHVPGWSDTKEDPGKIQWTLWIVIQVGGEWLTAGCLEFWPEDNPSLGTHKGGDPAPFSDGAKNWWYNMPGMAGIQPPAGQRIGVFVTQGSQRKKDVHAVTERSNVAWMNIPPNDTGVFIFSGEPSPNPQPDPKPDPKPDPRPDPDMPSDQLAKVMALMNTIRDEVILTKQQDADLVAKVDALGSKVDGLLDASKQAPAMTAPDYAGRITLKVLGRETSADILLKPKASQS